jgi:hypothetical protein
MKDQNPYCTSGLAFGFKTLLFRSLSLRIDTEFYESANTSPNLG